MTKQEAEKIREHIYPKLWGSLGAAWVHGFMLNPRPVYIVRGTPESKMYSLGKRMRKRYEKA